VQQVELGQEQGEMPGEEPNHGMNEAWLLVL
jgi:hypothetical protein